MRAVSGDDDSTCYTYIMNTSGKRSLEKYRIFPYIAWTLTAGFALFVYGIVTELQAVTTGLQAQTNELERQISISTTDEADFDTFTESRYGTDASSE